VEFLEKCFVKRTPDLTLVVGHAVEGRPADPQGQHDGPILAVDDQQVTFGAAGGQGAEGVEGQGQHS